MDAQQSLTPEFAETGEVGLESGGGFGPAAEEETSTADQLQREADEVSVDVSAVYRKTKRLLGEAQISGVDVTEAREMTDEEYAGFVERDRVTQYGEVNDVFLRRFGRLDQRAQELYIQHEKRSQVIPTSRLRATYSEDLGSSRSPVYQSSQEGYTDKVLKISNEEPDPIIGGHRSFSEGPVIETLRDLLEVEGQDPSLLPEVYRYGLTTDGKRFVEMEKINGEQVFKPLGKRRGEELYSGAKPTTVDLIQSVGVVSEAFTVFEKHGFGPMLDLKPEEIFITPEGKVRLIDFDVFHQDADYADGKETADFYRNMAGAFIDLNADRTDLPMGMRSKLRAIFEDGGGVDELDQRLSDSVKNGTERRMVAVMLRDLSGYGPQGPMNHEKAGRLAENAGEALEKIN